MAELIKNQQAPKSAPKPQSAKRKKRGMNWFTRLLLVLLIVAIVVGGVGGILITRTPRELGMQGFMINNVTLEEMGISDVKIIDIIKSFSSFLGVEESDMVKHPYDDATEKAQSDNKFEGSSLKDVEDYSSVLTTKVVYDNEYLIEYNDSTLAYIINNAIHTLVNESENENVKFMKDANITIKEMTITKTGEIAELRYVCKMELASLKDQIQSSLGVFSSILSVPDSVYIVTSYNFTVDSTTGQMIITPKDVFFNGNQDDQVINAIIDVIVDSIEGVESIDDISAKIGEATRDIMFHLGKIGTATVGENSLITGDIVFGMNGVNNSKMSFITHIAP